jgi:DNA-binding CsgD family transcriptional regulator
VKGEIAMNIESVAMCSGKEFPARAYEGYLNQGRGAQVIRLSEIKELSRSPGYYSFPWKYSPAGSDLLKQLGLWPDERMVKALEEYDPESEVLIVIIATDGVAHCYSRRMHGDSLPSKAYEWWRREYPIGLRLNPEHSRIRHLKELAAFAKEQEQARRSARKKILSNPESQAGFIRSLIDSQQRLSEEISTKGYKSGGSEDMVYEPRDECNAPGTAWERLQEGAALVDYMVATTALNQVLSEYERREGEGWLEKAALVGFDALSDKYLITLAGLTTSDCEDEMREYFTYMAAALLSTRLDLRRNPRLRAALTCDGGDPEEELLLRLGHCIPLAWEEYTSKPHTPFENDGNIFVNLVVEELERDEPESCHHARIRSQRLRRESSQEMPAVSTQGSPLEGQSLTELRAYVEIPASQSQADFDFATSSIAMQVFERHLAERESMIDVQNLLIETPLTAREAEVLNLQLRGETNVEIARELGIAASTIGAHLSSITKKLRRTKDRIKEVPRRRKDDMDRTPSSPPLPLGSSLVVSDES